LSTPYTTYSFSCILKTTAPHSNPNPPPPVKHPQHLTAHTKKHKIGAGGRGNHPPVLPHHPSTLCSIRQAYTNTNKNPRYHAQPQKSSPHKHTRYTQTIHYSHPTTPIIPPNHPQLSSTMQTYKTVCTLCTTAPHHTTKPQRLSRKKQREKKRCAPFFFLSFSSSFSLSLSSPLFLSLIPPFS